jgi:hypothetical protein
MLTCSHRSDQKSEKQIPSLLSEALSAKNDTYNITPLVSDNASFGASANTSSSSISVSVESSQTHASSVDMSKLRERLGANWSICVAALIQTLSFSTVLFCALICPRCGALTRGFVVFVIATNFHSSVKTYGCGRAGHPGRQRPNQYHYQHQSHSRRLPGKRCARFHHCNNHTRFNLLRNRA